MRRAALFTTALALGGCVDFGKALDNCIESGACTPAGTGGGAGGTGGGTGGTGGGTPALLRFAVEPAFQPFGGVEIGATARATMFARNTGEASVAAPNVVTSDLAIFAIENDACAGAGLLEVDAGCSFDVVFKPVTTATLNEHVTAARSGAITGDATLSGFGTPAGVRFELAPAIDFPDTQLGANTTQLVTLRNTGTLTFPVLTPGASGVIAGSSDYAVVTNTCDQSNLAPDASCGVDLRFTPQDEGRRGGQYRFQIAGSDYNLAIDGGCYALVQVVVQMVSDAGAGANNVPVVFSDDGGLACPGSCVQTVRRGAQLTLTTGPSPLTARYATQPAGFIGPGGAQCGTLTSCNLTAIADAGVVLANVKRLNRAWYTSTRYPGWFAINGRDTPCVTAANAMGYDPAEWVAFALGRDAGTLYGQWFRMDGQPFATSTDAILRNGLMTSLGYSETGARPSNNLWMGQLDDGGLGDCNGWTADSGMHGGIGSPRRDDAYWMQRPSGECGSSLNSVMCLETSKANLNLPLTLTVPTGGKLAFASTAFVTGALNDFDAGRVCDAEAGAAGSGRFLAFRRTGGVFPTVAPATWYRPDGIRVTFVDAGTVTSPIAPIDRTATTAIVTGSGAFWAGNGGDCSGWTTEAATGGNGSAFEGGSNLFNGGTLSCDAGLRLLCVER